MTRSFLTALVLAALVIPSSGLAAAGKTAQSKQGRPKSSLDGDWPAYGRDPGGGRYSPLAQINRENVARLQVAWTYRTGDVSDGSKGIQKSTFQATPILVDGTLYLSTPFNRVIALDPETGAERWSYDPKLNLSLLHGDGMNSRGVSTWLDARRAAGEPCRRRIFLAANDGRLIALDAARGKPCPEFGNEGSVDLNAGVANFRPGEYHMTSPPAVIQELVIVGSSIDDNTRVDMPSGVVRAYDARSGALRWSWDPIPRDPRDPARKTWRGESATKTGAANVWSAISVDPERGLVFLPTSSPSPDFYGGERKGDNRYSNSVVALRASTGRVVWHFQVVHHDVWDYDVPAQPALVTVRRNGRRIPAVVVATKMGHLFVLHRETGKPLFPVEERKAPQNPAPGEELSITQPFPTAPPPLAPQKLLPEDAWGLTPEDRDGCRDRIKSLRNEGIFTPPSVEGTIIYPGAVGGMNWSGVSFDPERGLLIANTNRLAFVVSLIPREKFEAARASRLGGELAPQSGTPFGMKRELLVSKLGLPCSPPPWGTLTAVDLSTGKVKWEVPLGTMEDVVKSRIPFPVNLPAGAPNLGGSIATAGGLVFIAGAMDNYLRAFDTETGRELWKGRLPAGGQATPMTYRVGEGGKQYVVICAGGHGRLGTTLGDYVVAFALP